MLRAGLTAIALAAAAGCFAALWSLVPDQGSVGENRSWFIEFGKVGLVASLVIGVPLVLGGTAASVDDAAVAWIALGLGVVLGVAVCAFLLTRFPVLRLNVSVWDSGAQIGAYGRRRSILVMALVLAFAAVLMLASVVV